MLLADGATPSAAPWLTIVTAVITFAGTLTTAYFALRAARSSAVATQKSAESAAASSKAASEISSAASRFLAQSDRFADWQMHKRKLYSDLLALLTKPPIQRTSDELASAISAAALVAYPPLREALFAELDRANQQPAVSIHPIALRDLVATMTSDVDRTPKKERERAELEAGKVQ